MDKVFQPGDLVEMTKTISMARLFGADCDQEPQEISPFVTEAVILEYYEAKKRYGVVIPFGKDTYIWIDAFPGECKFLRTMSTEELLTHSSPFVSEIGIARMKRAPIVTERVSWFNSLRIALTIFYLSHTKFSNEKKQESPRESTSYRRTLSQCMLRLDRIKARLQSIYDKTS